MYKKILLFILFVLLISCSKEKKSQNITVDTQYYKSAFYELIIKYANTNIKSVNSLKLAIKDFDFYSDIISTLPYAISKLIQNNNSVNTFNYKITFQSSFTKTKVLDNDVKSYIGGNTKPKKNSFLSKLKDAIKNVVSVINKILLLLLIIFIFLDIIIFVLYIIATDNISNPLDHIGISFRFNDKFGIIFKITIVIIVLYILTWIVHLLIYIIDKI